jgi:hypothetical protein
MLQFASQMTSSFFAVKKPVFFLLSGALVVFCLATGFLYRQKQVVLEQNRQLIIRNDSIMSVNILLNDSLQQKPLGVSPKKSFVLKSR